MSIGTTLRAARESKGYTISYVAELTNIMVRVIEDLESDNFKRIAAPIYGRGFIKLYAGILGLDPDPLLDEYNAIVSGGDRRPADPPPPITPRPPVAATAPAGDEKSALARILEQRMAEEKRTADLILVKPGAASPGQPAGGLHGVTMIEEDADQDPVWEDGSPESDLPPETVESPLHGVVVSEEELEPLDADPEPVSPFPEEPQPVRFPVKAPAPIAPMPEDIPLVMPQVTPPPPVGEPDLFTMADERKRTFAQPAGSPLAQPIPPAGPDRRALFNRPKNAPIFRRPGVDERPEEAEEPREGARAMARIALCARGFCGKVIVACSGAFTACRARCGAKRIAFKTENVRKVALIASVACAVLLVGVAIYMTMTGNPDAAPAEKQPDSPTPAQAQSVPVKAIAPLAPPPAPYFD